MSEKIAKKMEMIQNLRGVADCPAMSFVFVCWHCQKYKSVELGDQL